MTSSRPFQPVPGFSSVKLSQSTLIVPTVAIGNVPQLAIDLLLQTLKFDKVGVLDSVYLYPFASPIDVAATGLDAEYKDTRISNALEVYFNEDHNLTVIQQRSPIIPSFRLNFVKEIIQPFIVDSKFSKIVILDSSDAGLVEQYNYGDIQLYTNEDILNKSLEALTLDKSDPIKLSSKIPYDYTLYARDLINTVDELNVATKIELNVLVIFVYEGDNFHDGEALAARLTKLLDGIDVSEWVKPLSWFGVYGDRPIPSAMEEGLYG